MDIERSRTTYDTFDSLSNFRQVGLTDSKGYTYRPDSIHNRNRQANLNDQTNTTTSTQTISQIDDVACEPTPKNKKKKECQPIPGIPHKLGGSYREVRDSNEGGEVHHMPAKASILASNIPLDDDFAPAICMTKADHKQTASWGNSVNFRNQSKANTPRPFSKPYKQEQTRLLNLGRFDEVFQTDIQDIRTEFGGQYNEHLRQAIDYRYTLPPDQLIPK